MRSERERQSSILTVLGAILFAVAAVGATAAVVAPGVVVGQSPTPPGPLDDVLSDPTVEDAPPEGPAGAGSEDSTGRTGSLETDDESEGTDDGESAEPGGDRDDANDDDDADTADGDDAEGDGGDDDENADADDDEDDSDDENGDDDDDDEDDD